MALSRSRAGVALKGAPEKVTARLIGKRGAHELDLQRDPMAYGRWHQSDGGAVHKMSSSG